MVPRSTRSEESRLPSHTPPEREITKNFFKSTGHTVTGASAEILLMDGDVPGKNCVREFPSSSATTWAGPTMRALAIPRAFHGIVIGKRKKTSTEDLWN
ncbi:MAG: hypothetical protein BWY88_00952 [Synergistetes bacterium ADurb.Bin520]|nr:MAG: hypothetical protein BWY88_00952 [Synergistetes bacterium ADurb.Bin520]